MTPTPDGPKTNRRSFARARATADGQLFEVTAEGTLAGPIACAVTDFSRGGMGITSRRMLHVGVKIVVVLPAHEGDTRVLAGEVRNVRYAGQGLHHIGAQFCPVPEVVDKSVLFNRAA